MVLDWITRNAEMMGGKPCLRGLRVAVGTIVGLVAAGHSHSGILAAYPYLEDDNIRQALAYAAWRVEEIGALDGTASPKRYTMTETQRQRTRSREENEVQPSTEKPL